MAILVPTWKWLQEHGRVREGLALLAPFLEESVRARMDPALAGQLLGTLGTAHYRLGEAEKAEALLRQAKAIGEQIRDPRIVREVTAALEKLSEPG